jgi:hypothetical protein
MIRRAHVVVTLSAASMLACASAAQAGSYNEYMSLDDAQSRVNYPIWALDLPRWRQELVGMQTCDYASDRPYAYARYRRRGSRARLGYHVAFPRWRCGYARSVAFRTVRVHGQRVKVHVYCHGPRFDKCDAGRRQGFRYGFTIPRMRMPARVSSGERKARRTVLGASSRYMTLRMFVQALRALRPVDLSRPRVQLQSFLAAEGTIWCHIGDGDPESDAGAWCATEVVLHPDGSFTSRRGGVDEDGNVSMCQDQPQPCIQNWNPDLPVIADGQRSAVKGVRCAAEAAAVTCTRTRGNGKGRGFRIDAGSVREISGVLTERHEQRVSPRRPTRSARGDGRCRSRAALSRATTSRARRRWQLLSGETAAGGPSAANVWTVARPPRRSPSAPELASIRRG